MRIIFEKIVAKDIDVCASTCACFLNGISPYGQRKSPILREFVLSESCSGPTSESESQDVNHIPKLGM